MNTLFAHAYLLRSTPFRDSDLVVSLLTPELGQQSALARGARNSRKRFGGALDYFCLLRAELRPARTGMAKLLGVELIHSHEKIGGDVDRYMAGSHMLEVSRLSTREGDPSTDAFTLLRATLETLDDGGDPASLVRIFQTKTIAFLGYALGGDVCAYCAGSTLGGEGGVLHIRDGAPACLDCAGPGAVRLGCGARKTLERATALPLDRLNALRISGQIEEELGPVVQQALTRALGVEPRSLAQIQKIMTP